MSRPESVEHGASFDLTALDRELRQEEAYRREGHTGRTLVREPDLRVVLVVMMVGARLAEHQVQETAAIQVLHGHVRLRLPDRSVDLASGALLVLDKGLAHDIEAAVESAFVLTIGWNEANALRPRSVA